MNKYFLTDDMRKRKSENMKNKWKDPVYRQNQIRKRLGKPTWQKKLGDNHPKVIIYKNKLRIQAKERMLGKRVIKNKNCLMCRIQFEVWGKNDKNFCGLSCSTKYRNKYNNPMRNASSKLKMQKSLKGLKTWNTGLTNVYSAETLLKMSQNRKGKAVGKDNGSYGKSPSKKPYINNKHYMYKNINFRSSWERIFAEWLDQHKLEWGYEVKRFYFKTKEMSYLPDFYLKDLDCYVEIKGWMSDKTKERLDLFHIEFPNIKLILITDIKKIDEVMNGYSCGFDQQQI